jgi:hypothetical protein
MVSVQIRNNQDRSDKASRRIRCRVRRALVLKRFGWNVISFQDTTRMDSNPFTL